MNIISSAEGLRKTVFLCLHSYSVLMVHEQIPYHVRQIPYHCVNLKLPHSICLIFHLFVHMSPLCFSPWLPPSLSPPPNLGHASQVLYYWAILYLFTYLLSDVKDENIIGRLTRIGIGNWLLNLRAWWSFVTLISRFSRVIGLYTWLEWIQERMGKRILRQHRKLFERMSI